MKAVEADKWGNRLNGLLISTEHRSKHGRVSPRPVVHFFLGAGSWIEQRLTVRKE